MLRDKRTSDKKSVYFAQKFSYSYQFYLKNCLKCGNCYQFCFKNIGFLAVLMKRWKKAAKMFQKIN
jgi:CO dehydrogenase/acetyl-CoA synthase alpha subunit